MDEREVMIMTRNELWDQLDAVCASPDRSQSLLHVSDLLKDAYSADLPLLIACTRSPGRIHHSYANFQEGGKALAGNRYLICFTNPGQAHRPVAPLQKEEPLSLEERFRLIDEGTDEDPSKKPRRTRRKKATSVGPMWKASPVSETATVRTRDVLDYMKRSRAVGGLIFNVYDEKHSVVLPKFMIG